MNAVSSPGTGVAVYDTYNFGGWGVFGGTSVATLRRYQAAHANAQPRAQIAFPMTHEALAKVVSDPDFQKLLANVGSYSHAMNAKEALAFVEQQQATWLPVLEKIPVK